MNEPTAFVLQDHYSDQLTEMITDLGIQVSLFHQASTFLAELAQQPRNASVIVNLKESVNEGPLIQQQALHQSISVPFIFVIDKANTPFAVSVVRRGAVSVLERPISMEKLKHALEEALMSADVYRAFAESGTYHVRLDALPERERRIVQLAADGMPNKRIASILGLSVKTVEKQRRQAYQRLHVSSTAEMTRAVTLGNLHPLLASTVAWT